MNRRDYRLLALLVLLSAAAGLTALFRSLPDRSQTLSAPTDAMVQGVMKPAHPGELHERFQQAAVMLHAGQHLYALEALERVLEIAPSLPEAHVNAGFALIGLDRHRRAQRHFQYAIDLRPTQLNAYYGLALSLEGLGELDGALGAMRTFVHLAGDSNPHARRAWSAIWEWQNQSSAMARASGPASAAATDPKGKGS